MLDSVMIALLEVFRYMRNRIRNKKLGNQKKINKKHEMWQINNKNAITFLFSIRILNGLHNREGLIFLDFKEFLKNYPLKFKIDLKFWEKMIKRH